MYKTAITGKYKVYKIVYKTNSKVLLFDVFSNVTTSLGTVTGLHVTGNIEYFSFRGIPYANATRFKVRKLMCNTQNGVSTLKTLHLTVTACWKYTTAFFIVIIQRTVSTNSAIKNV